MRLLSTMMLSSNFLFCLFLLVNYFYGKMLSACWKCRILKISLLLSIIPIAYIRTAIEAILFKIFPFSENIALTLDGHKQFIIVAPTEIQISVSLRYELAVFTIWLSIGIIVFFLRSSHYFLQKKAVLSSMKSVSTPEILKTVEQYRTALKIRRSVRLYICPPEIPPFTIGVWSPVVVLPDNIDLDKMELIIHHELCHIKSYDNLYKFIRPLVVGFYWFNPIFYLLDYYLEKTTELACDEEVIQTKPSATRKIYSSLILEMASSYKKDAGIYTSMFCSSKENCTHKDFKERITIIMKSKKTSTKHKIISTLLALFIVFCSSIPTFAYQAPKKYEVVEDNDELVHITPDETIVFNPIGATAPFASEPILFDEQFTSSNGMTYDLQSDTKIPKANCEHTYVPGSYTSHSKKSDGGCVVKYYNAKRCSKCGKLVKGSLTNTVTYQVCPH